ncbi:unnamed protein product [Cuscuta europaea]|uniref:E3 ubiquitin-protein ligase RMA n=1 Tax=Cuscuta europaea TaxID=41803 RepID=A0A9P1EHV5_CUSEU|nr:unnamed protein product [Cuscuta europaea]
MVSDDEDGATTHSTSSRFDCNICLDSAHDPVVTFCGHLYCWPCIYLWLSTSNEHPSHHPNCPVCKSYISKSTLVPLYGDGVSSSSSFSSSSSSSSSFSSLSSSSSSSSDSESKKHQPNIPQRPPALSVGVVHDNPDDPPPPLPSEPPPYLPHSFRGSHDSTRAGIGGTVIAGFFNPTIGEMFSAAMFGSYDANLLLAFPSLDPRIRRQDIMAGRSLHRLYIFLVFCLILCLLLF